MARLTIKATGWKEGQPASFIGTQVYLDGKPLLDLTEVRVSIKNRELVHVAMEMEVEELNVDLEDPFITVNPSPLTPQGEIPANLICKSCGGYPVYTEWAEEGQLLTDMATVGSTVRASKTGDA